MLKRDRFFIRPKIDISIDNLVFLFFTCRVAHNERLKTTIILYYPYKFFLGELGSKGYNLIRQHSYLRKPLSFFFKFCKK